MLLNSPPTRATWPAHLLLDWITRMTFCKEYTRWSSCFCSLFRSPVTSSFLGPKCLPSLRAIYTIESHPHLTNFDTEDRGNIFCRNVCNSRVSQHRLIQSEHAITCSFLIITGCSGISRWYSLKNSSPFFTLNDEPWGQILNHFLVMCFLPTCHTEEEWDQERKVSKRKKRPIKAETNKG
jgi:hypothetical protein